MSAIAGEGYSIVADTTETKVLDNYEVVTLTVSSIVCFVFLFK